jgi:chemotaxis methyl-accepting protein methylase
VSGLPDGKETGMFSEKSRASGRQRAALDAVIQVMDQAHGLDITIFNESFLTKSVEKRLQATACRTSGAYLKRLSEDGAEAEALFRSLRVVYSEFFRNPLTFALLEQQILPGLVQEKARNGEGEIRIWSAGCAAGQEAWSVAILLDEAAAACERPVPYRIFATDLSETDLAIARKGIYSAAAVRNVRLRHLDSCFSRKGDIYTLAPRLKSRVDFSVYDLLAAGTTCPPVSIYGHFDIILCSNVLMYYQDKALHIIVDKLRKCLAPGGYLVTGETERQIVAGAGGFREVTPPTAIFRRVP